MRKVKFNVGNVEYDGYLIGIAMCVKEPHEKENLIIAKTYYAVEDENGKPYTVSEDHLTMIGTPVSSQPPIDIDLEQIRESVDLYPPLQRAQMFTEMVNLAALHRVNFVNKSQQ